MKRFSDSDLRHLRGKQLAAVELLFCELRDVLDVAKRLFTTEAGVWMLVRRARLVLAALEILLPDRRFAVGVSRFRVDDQFSTPHRLCA